MEITDFQVDFFRTNGYLQVDNLLTMSEVEAYRYLYEDFLSGVIDAGAYRSDLGAHVDDRDKIVREKITQIMVPSRIMPTLLQGAAHLRSLAIARQLLGNDLALDFDMLIDKAPFTNAATPWHQDCAYWINMPDKRAVSCWISLDHAKVDNGCMWYVPASHLLPVREHQPAGKGGGALECICTEAEGIAVELAPGSCVFHHGGTLHYSRGNATEMRRRAFITNFRPHAMIELERTEGYDHTGEKKVRNEDSKES